MTVLLSLLAGLAIWLVLYVGIMATLDWLVRRGIENPAVPRYVGMTREKFEPGRPWRSARGADHGLTPFTGTCRKRRSLPALGKYD